MGLAYYACLDPLVIVKQGEPKQLKTASPPYATHGRGGDLLSAPLLAPEERAAIDSKRRPRIVRVEGAAWVEFFERVTVTLDRRGKTDWTARFPAGSHPMKALFFRPGEPPLDTLALPSDGGSGRAYLQLDEGGKIRYLEFSFRRYSDSDFRLGSGFSSYPKPPAVFLYPYRSVGLVVVLGGVVLYLFLPRKRRQPGSLRYDEWRVVLSDILGVVFTFFPLVISVLAVGGSLQALNEGWPLFLFLSPFFAGGLLVLWIAAWYGSYEVVPLQEGLGIETFRGKRLYRYGDMISFQPIVFAPPRWLIALSWVVVLASAGAARPGAVGSALLLSSSFGGNIGIRLRSGAMLYVSVTDQMGNISLKGFEGIMDVLRRRGVREITEAIVVRSLGFEVMGSERPAG